MFESNAVGDVPTIIALILAAVVLSVVLLHLLYRLGVWAFPPAGLEDATEQPLYDPLYVARLIAGKLADRKASPAVSHRYALSLEIEVLQRLHMHHGYPIVDSPLMDDDDYSALEGSPDES